MCGIFRQLRIYLVGPSGQRGQLERAALQVPDVRLRPEVVYNFLKIRSVVQGGAPPPDLAALTALIEPPGGPSAVERHVRATACMTSPAAESAERAAAGSDVANVRVGAQSDAHARVTGYEEAHADAPPQMDAIGVLSVLCGAGGISELVSTTGDGDGDGGQRDDGGGEFDGLPGFTETSDGSWALPGRRRRRLQATDRRVLGAPSGDIVAPMRDARVRSWRRMEAFGRTLAGFARIRSG